MKKFYFSELKLCNVCKKFAKKFIETNNEFICEACFLKQAGSKSRQACSSRKSQSEKKPRKLFAKLKNNQNLNGRNIYAIHGITSVINGGCTN